MKTNFKLLLAFLLLSTPLMAQPHPSVTLSWSWSQGASDPITQGGFHIWRATTSGGPYTLVGTVLSPVTAPYTFLDLTVSVGTTYFYAATAFNPGGESSKSTEVTCVIPFLPPASPTGLSGSVK